MEHYPRNRFLFHFLTLVFIIIACQEDASDDLIEPVDEDMLAATRLAEEYLNSSAGRQGAEKAITVLRFEGDKLVFATNTDSITGYQEITEETITAVADAGEYVFWYSGGGLSDLDEIEFDEESQLQLVDAPEEINADKMWMIAIPPDFNEEGGILKYDIIYKIKGSSGPPIRLDPKIKITQDAGSG